MPGFATGNLAIAVCDRCNTKRQYLELIADGDKPGLRVCAPWVEEGCWDHKDPYRLPPRQPDRIVLRYPRPDVSIAVQSGEEIVPQVGLCNVFPFVSEDDGVTWIPWDGDL